LTTTNDTFKAAFAAADIVLNNAPTGTTIASINRVDANNVDVTLAFTGADFDADVTNFNVTALANGLTDGLDLTTGTSTIAALVESVTATKADGTALALTEANLNTAVVRLTTTNDTFKAGIAAADIVLNNAPTGTTIASINRVDANNVDVTLAFTGADFDADVTNFNVTALANGLTAGLDLTTGNSTITALVESVAAAATPVALTETNLNNAVVRLTTTNDTFKAGIAAADIQLNNAPTGTTIASINRVDANNVDVTLAFTGADFDADVTNFNMTALANGLTAGAALTTGNMTIAEDVISPTVSIVTGATTLLIGDVVTARSSEIGTIYFLQSSASVTDKASLDALVSGGTAVKAAAPTADTDTDFNTTGLAAGTYKAYAVDVSGNVSVASTSEVALVAKPFVISGGTLDTVSGIRATVSVAPTNGLAPRVGNEVVVFQLMKGTEPVSIVALEKDVLAAEAVTTHFNVTGTDYSVKVFVVDNYSSSFTDVGTNLAEAVTLQ
jgi:hypothetical protein